MGLLVLEIFFPIYSQWKIMHPGYGQFGPQGHGWQNLCRGPLDIALYQIYKMWAWTLMAATLLMAHSPFKVFMSMGELCWQLEFQSNQPKNLMHPFPYHMCFTWNLMTTQNIYFFENVNKQWQQTINILIIIPHLSLWLEWVISKTMWPKIRS